jgi:hypothetical protein
MQETNRSVDHVTALVSTQHLMDESRVTPFANTCYVIKRVNRQPSGPIRDRPAVSPAEERMGVCEIQAQSPDRARDQ